MSLKNLLKYEKIAIQAHDDPDADALASGFALHSFLSGLGREPFFFYGGAEAISKPDLRLMVEKLDIPIKYAPDFNRWDGLLLTVDCAYGNNNVQPVQAALAAVIDHHPSSLKAGVDPSLSTIQPTLGSCATLVWSLLERADFRPFDPLAPTPIPPALRDRLAIALYFGLYMDTSGLAELRHPLDRDMRDALTVSRQEKLIQEEAVLKQLLNSRLSRADLEKAQKALRNIEIDEANRLALIPVASCGPHLLGYISDLAIQVSELDLVTAWTEHHQGLKFSVRSSGREIKARDLTLWFVRDGVGDGGGHMEKAGGCLREITKNRAKRFFRRETQKYLENYTVIDCVSSTIGHRIKGMRKYRRREIVCGYIPSTDLFEPGARLRLRMLEGDATITAGGDIIIMLGVKGEVYFMNREVFEKEYHKEKGIYAPMDEPEYPPTVSRILTGEKKELLGRALNCRRRPGLEPVLAKRLTRSVKVFPAWDGDNYLLGEKGDWLVNKSRGGPEPLDLYVVRAGLFPLLYEEAAGL